MDIISIMPRIVPFLLVFLACTSIISSSAYPTDDTSHPSEYQLTTRQSPRRGIRVLHGKCTGRQLLSAKNAILDASYLATAGLNAASSFESLPFSYFFSSNVNTANYVASVLQRVVDSQQGKAYPIDVTCEDVYDRCAPGSTSYAASFRTVDPSYPSLIILCPLAFSRRRNPTPCTANPGVLSLGWLMLHTMVTTHTISAPPKEIVETESETARSVQEALRNGKDTTRIADAYAHLGSWSWDMGLGGPPWDQKKVCLGNFWRGRFDEVGLDEATNNGPPNSK